MGLRQVRWEGDPGRGGGRKWLVKGDGCKCSGGVTCKVLCHSSITVVDSWVFRSRDAFKVPLCLVRLDSSFSFRVEHPTAWINLSALLHAPWRTSRLLPVVDNHESSRYKTFMCSLCMAIEVSSQLGRCQTDSWGLALQEAAKLLCGDPVIPHPHLLWGTLLLHMPVSILDDQVLLFTF